MSFIDFAKQEMKLKNKGKIMNRQGIEHDI